MSGNWKCLTVVFICSFFLVVGLVSNVNEASAKTSYEIKNKKLVDVNTNKVVTKTILYKKKLYKKGVLAKGTVLYKKKLYKKGVLAKGTVVYKKKLYKNGKNIKDKVKPVLTLSNKKTSYKVAYNGKFTIPTAKASDKVSGKLTVQRKILNEDGELVSYIIGGDPGKYTITFTATDNEKNKVTKKITVVVEEPEEVEVIGIY